MKIFVNETPEKSGEIAALAIADALRDAIGRKGEARIVLSTGASQFSTISVLIRQDVDWSRVTMFHLDEYIGLPESHPASFRKYLKERFVSQVPLGRAVFVDGGRDPAEAIKYLTASINEAPIDIGVIGIGVNAHIAFNDPPADFVTKESYMTVNLDDQCKMQQVGEGWFAAVDEVPRRAITMTPYQIMRCERIVSAVPGAVKAQAIKRTLESSGTDPMIPATLLKTHKNVGLYLDKASASACAPEVFAAYETVFA